ncbi:MAG: GNAT family N-acetyltransferase [Clostridiales bacterium]|nr:GNAT family N-acetyltransferase [Clostridiales bacterium]
MNKELLDLYERNFPLNVRKKKTVLEILNNTSNNVIEQRGDNDELIGAAIVNQSTIIMLCVDAPYRNEGIGTALLAKAETAVKNSGFDSVNVGAGFDYLMPGVPTSKRYCSAENEQLYSHVDESASRFFENRGYVHSWGCNCFDMEAALAELPEIETSIGSTIDGITYRFASIDDMGSVCECIDDAFSEFTEYYQNTSLYSEDSNARVLIAVDGNSTVAGTLIVKIEDESKRIGAAGCTTVRHAYRGRHIAVDLVKLGTQYLKSIGLERGYLSYTYTGLDHMYGYAGYKICCYYMMAQKTL